MVPPLISWHGTTCCARSSWAPRRGAWVSRFMLAISVPDFVLVQGVFYGLGYGLLAARAGAGLPHQPGAQLRPGPDRRDRCRVPGQAHRGLQVQLLVRPGALGRAGRLCRCDRRTRAAPAVQPPPRARHGGHHRPQLRAAGPDRPPVHRAPQPLPAGSGSLRPFLLAGALHHHLDGGAHPHRGPDW